MRIQERLLDLYAKQEATDAVLTSLMAILLSDRHDASVAISSVRTMLNVTATSSDGSDAFEIKLKVEEHIQQLMDRIERMLR